MKERTFSKEIYLISGKDTVIDFWVVLCLVCRLGFPGTLADSYAILTPVFDYGSSALELLLIFLAGADTIDEIRLLDLKKKYGLIYVMMGILLIQSFFGNQRQKSRIYHLFSPAHYGGLCIVDGGLLWDKASPGAAL